jgi:uroporphyrin-III C-methyltransferase/precorrin-2 dehydrogenase/sirohydrochlorin ferrochelatase
VLAQKLRARIEAMLPPELGALARLGETFRTTAERMLPKGQPRRRFWSAFFEGRVADAALSGRVDEARRLASRLLSQSGTTDRGFVWFVGAGPGAPDLLTLRAQLVLQEADVVVHDAAIPDAVVSMGRRDAERIAVDRTAGRDDIAAIVLREASAGRRVVRLVPGDSPALGRHEETAGLCKAGIAFDLVPGVALPAAVELPASTKAA